MKPTRDDVEQVLIAHQGEGKPAMVSAVQAMKSSFPELTDGDLAKIISDLPSYTEYLLEP